MNLLSIDIHCYKRIPLGSLLRHGVRVLRYTSKEHKVQLGTILTTSPGGSIGFKQGMTEQVNCLATIYDSRVQSQLQTPG